MRRLSGHGIQMLISILLSLTLWTYVSFTNDPTVDRVETAAVVPVNLSPGLVLVDLATGLPDPGATTVTFHASGADSDMKGLRPEVFKPRLDLSSVGEGYHVVPVRIDPLQGVRIGTIVPATVTVRIEQRRERQVPVVVKPRGQLPFVYTVGQIRQSQDQATVSGPAPLVQQVVATNAPVSLQNQTTDLDVSVALEPVNANDEVVHGVTVGPTQVQVVVPITSRVQDQQASVVPNIVGVLPPGFVLGPLEWEPKFVKVLAAGTVTGTLVTEPISLTGLTSSVTRTVRLAPTPNVITEPPDVVVRVRLTVNALAVRSELPLLVPIAPINIGEGLDAVASPLALEVTLAGPFAQLTKLTVGAVRATVDLQGQGPGTHRLPVILTVPPEVQRVAPTNPEVTVTLTARPPVTPTAVAGAPTPPPKATP